MARFLRQTQKVNPRNITYIPLVAFFGFPFTPLNFASQTPMGIQPGELEPYPFF